MNLTDQNLETLGVVLGDRRKMLRAIAKLYNAPAAAGPYPDASRSRRGADQAYGTFRLAPAIGTATSECKTQTHNKSTRPQASDA
jgi:hypothetical protein